MIFQNGEVTVEMEIEPFKKSSHVVSYSNYPDSKTKYVYAIDHAPYWGHDGGVPTNQFKKLACRFGATTINLPQKALRGLYGHKYTGFGNDIKATEKYCSVYRTQDKKRYYLFMWFSDGAGAYEVTWIFENGKYLRRVVDTGY